MTNNVAKVGIFNIVGKEVRSYRHNPGNTYEIDDLSRGIYIVRMLDAEETIKSIRLSKKIIDSHFNKKSFSLNLEALFFYSIQI